ncbi:MAG: PLP-dependent transferase [Rhodobacteraceae bacterium]|nr:PLP-dependent transferase [Paracoccaceae bacterium]
MTHDPFSRWDLTPVINASGTMTGIGAARVPKDIRRIVNGILASFVNMDELQSRAGAVIARLTGAEAGCVTSCSAAAMVQTVAATLTGCNLARIEALPAVTGARRVLLPAGHMVNYGAPVDQAIRLTGAEVIPIGTAAACETWHLEAALEEGAAAAFYVVSHHTVRENEMPIDVFIALCREHDVPVIVDMASEYDLTGPIAHGASVAIYSGHKFLSGVTSGIVAGAAELIRATYLQHFGIGRVMKAGKESVTGAMAALESWEERDHEAAGMEEDARVASWITELAPIPGLTLSRHDDWTGNPIRRARIDIDAGSAGFHAWELADRLRRRSPSIVVRDDLVERQEIYLDPCNLTDDEARDVSAAIHEEAARFRACGDGCRTSWSDIKRARAVSAVSWSGHAS